MSYVCLGPLTNLADALRMEPSAAKRIAAVFYYGLPPTAPEPGWNTSRDHEAAELVSGAGIPFYAASLTPEQALIFDAALYQEIGRIETEPARLMARLHQHEKTQKLLQADHFVAWDETVALYLDNPGIGVFKRMEQPDSIFRLVAWDRRCRPR